MTRRRLLLLSLAAIAVVLMVAWLLWPRTGITRENARRIELGMTLAEVEAILGGPARDESSGPLTHDLGPIHVALSHGGPEGFPAAQRWLRWKSDSVTVDVTVCDGRVIAVLG